MADKFHLPSVNLENRSFSEAIRAGNLNPFKQDAVILCSYRARFTRLGNDDNFAELKESLKPLCKRTLRRALEYVKYPNRHALVQEFIPTPDEQRL